MNNKFSSKNMSTVKYFTPINNLAVNNLTIDDLHEEQREDKLLEYYAIPILFSNDGKLLEDFEEKAQYYISIGEEIPEDIKKKLLETLEERKKRNKRNGWDA